ncbi:hypothetical protein ACSS6N_15180 [Peribacillus frigoritolerans]|uniref:hypothetical protein n=1 Tax=Peribacillus frigoritolerans TaxID=450367 RepID=UPI003F83EF69
MGRLQPYLSDDYKLCATESVVIVEKNIARKVFLDIFNTDDKYGLVLLSKLNPIAPGIFE